MHRYESYIVRIYRRDDKDPAVIFGMVEAVETGRIMKFTSVKELGAAICLSGKKRTKWKSGVAGRKNA